MVGLSDVIESSAKGLAKIVGVVAPGIASLLGTPFAGIALSLLGSAFGGNGKDINSLQSVIAADPEAELKLKTLEYDHQEAISKLNSQDFQVAVGDKQDARRYGGVYKDFLKHMAYLVTIGFFGALFVLYLPLNISADEKNLLSMLVGMLSSKWQTIIDFYYGSSSPISQGATHGSNLSK